MKNKILSILAIFITFITLSCKTDLIEKETTPQGKGLISIKIGNNAKMLSPNTANIDISSISSWTVTFTNKQDTTKQLQRITSSNETLKEYLPFGTYIIEIEGITQSDDDGSSTISFYGKTEAAISLEEKTTTANIYVAPKKSENGKGSFEYIITMEESEYVQPELNTFTAKLSSVNGNLPQIEITSDATVNSDEGTYTIEFTKHDIPSGYYTLTISCATIPSEDYPTSTTQILQKDILVEICDNAKTFDSITLEVGNSKILYAVTPTADDGDKYANYSGEFEQYPADFLNILNNDTITFAEIYMLNGNIPIIEPAKINDKFFDIYLYTNLDEPEYYGSIYEDYDKSGIYLAPNKSLMLLGNDNHQESILNLTISYTQVPSEPTTVTLLNGSPSIYLSSYSSSKFEFNINETSNYHDKPFMQYDSEEEEYLLRIFDDADNTKIQSFDGITLKGNDGNDKVVYTSIPQQLNDEPSYKIQYFILPSQKGSIPNCTITTDKTDLYIDEKVTFTIQGEFTPDTKFKWYANRLVQDSTDTSYTHTAQFTNDEVLCFIYQDENNYTTVNATESVSLSITTDTTPIALYSAVSGFYYLYDLTLTDVKKISKGEEYLYPTDSLIQDTMHYDNCYDNDGTLWWVTYSEIYNSNDSATATITGLDNLRYIDFDTIKNTLYATTVDVNASIYKITESTDGYIHESFFVTESPITCITFNDGYCYTIEEAYDTDTETQYILKKYNLSEIAPTTGQLTSKVKTKLLTKITDDTQNETITFTDLIFDNDNQIANTLKNPLFSDIQVTEEGIFVLFNDCYLYDDTINDIAYSNSRGGIIKFNSDLNLDSSFGSNGIFGWTNTKQTSSGKNISSDPYTIYSYMPKLFDNESQISTEHFYGPRKFIAIKPKKLIFTDDGFRFYCDNDESTDGKPTNHVIEFDIKTALFNSYNLDTQVKFDKEPTQYGYVIGSFSWDN